ncbi:hypothetical protein FSARC_6288 [Fusarium sarcochroum]|uniref:C3H1-type domain-containing protein n=1 Tax=Fusarium sarcochroum TaxID=1208366 RepID=A0A8H4TXZ8_9HYPO|nr:hypothetical protein FSARC_6288 [Fusarium sarcochroum]
MSQYVYGYGAPHGYQTSQPYYATNQTYTEPDFRPSETTEIQPSGFGHGAAEAYEYNQTAIPGLGMGLSQNATVWQTPWRQSAFGAQSDPSSSVARNHMARSDGNAALNVSASHSRKPEPGVDVDAMEEGELSEGELEDIYEPDEMDTGMEDRHGAQTSGFASDVANVGRQGETSQLPIANQQSGHGANERSWNSKQVRRERSGSYSPYLSPREIQSSGLENGTSHPQTPRSGTYNLPATELTIPGTSLHTNSDNIDATQQPEARQADGIISESKKRAEEAILRLWPLNVRYQNYIEEGIDQTLLDELFMELGLDLGTTVSSQKQPNSSTIPQITEVPSNAHDVQLLSPKPSVDIEKRKAVDQVKDKSEERKDRIARLLAAKGSKPTVVNADDSKPSALIPVPQTSTSSTKSEKTKTQSEKSKLIQQKMEALMKAREANAKATPQAQIPPEPALPPTEPESSRSHSLVPADLVKLDGQPATVPETADPTSAPSIPGLFLSSNAPSPTPNQRKRPVAADLNEYSTVSSPKHPFGQARESRPFLIDVSDDEDDAEMEIDSPELHPCSIQRPMTPGSRTTSFRDHPALPDSVSRNAVSSPKTAGTPTTSANGMYDLESMNKKIEDMKRKIAEAEARKKAKQTGYDSPLPQSQSQSKEGSVDVPAPSTISMHDASVMAEVVQSSPASATPQPHQSPDGSAKKLPKVRGQPPPIRPSLRARVASERLPILEARRREQAEQLKHLQSEVARIEKEIEHSLVEEDRLREDALQIEPEFSRQNESEPDVVQDEAPPYEPVPDDALTESAENNKTNLSRDEVERDTSMDESSSISSADKVEMGEPYQDKSQKDEQSRAEEITGDGDQSPLSTHSSVVHHTVNILGETAAEDAEEPEEDVAMEEAVTSSEEEDTADESADDYEPTDAGIDLPDPQSPIQQQSPPNRAPLSDSAVLETSDADIQGLARTTPVTKPISTGDGDTESESDREDEIPTTSKVSDGPKTSFVPYETPLQYFRAYRFHPQYNNSVSGGLRSLTYSNKIDVTREVCPDQLANGVCPRGSECQFQHFENMQVPDDQILLQLGAYGNYEDEQQQQYVEGLRALLTDFRNRRVKDFQAISKGIIEYRAKFHGDKTKILPLGGVTL